MSPSDKPLIWLQGHVKTPPFSTSARLEAGYLLRLLQKGHSISMPHSRPMPNIGNACHELRVVDRDVTWRLVYRTDVDAILILDVFSKKSRKTPQTVINNCRARLGRYGNEKE